MFMDLTILPNFSQICQSQISLAYLTVLTILSLGCGQEPVSRKPRFRALKAIFSQSAFKDIEVYTPETYCMRGALFVVRIRGKNSSVVTRFEILLRLFGCENFSGPSRNGLWPKRT